MAQVTVTDSPRAGLMRRLAAAFYDALLVFSLWFVATIPVLGLTGGEAVRPQQPLYFAYLVVLAFLYFGWSWTRGGQTLGMRAWRIQARGTDGGPVTWTAALLRFAGALLSWLCVGLGFLAALIEPERRTWHDRISGTVLVVLPKRSRASARGASTQKQ